MKYQKRVVFENSNGTYHGKEETPIELANDGPLAWHALNLWLLNPINLATLGRDCEFLKPCDFANIVNTLLQELWVSNWH